MSSERKEFLEKKWLSYPPFPAGFDSKYANRFSEISKMPMQVHVQLLPSLEIIKLLAVDLEKYLKPDDWVVAKVDQGLVTQIFLLAPALAEPLRLSSSSEIQKKWFQFLNQIEIFFTQKQFQQAQTPTVVVCPGTEPFLDLFSTELLVNGNKQKRYLTTSPEIHLKKMIAAGYRQVFEIKNCFRNGESSERHSPEFTMLEWYRCFVSLEQIIQDCLDLIEALHGKRPSFQRKSMAQLFQEKLQFKLTPATSIDELKALAKSLGLKADSFEIWDDVFYFIFVEKIEPFLDSSEPLFVEKYPPSQAAFARLTEDGWGDRFEIYWQGLELGNAFHELNDPKIQEQRFQEDLQKKSQIGKEVPNLDPEFMQALKSGMPPSSGIAMGLERLFMALNGIKEIKDLKVFN